MCRSLAALDLPQACREVIDKDASAVLDEIEAAIFMVASSILRGEGFSYDIPSRAKGNQVCSECDDHSFGDLEYNPRPLIPELTGQSLRMLLKRDRHLTTSTACTALRSRAGPHRAEGQHITASICQHIYMPQGCLHNARLGPCARAMHEADPCHQA